MKIYIYKNVSPVSTMYHDDGGVVIITDRKPQEAWYDHWAKIIKSKSDDYYLKSQLEIQKNELGDADKEFKTDATEEEVFIFEDAGCC